MEPARLPGAPDCYDAAMSRDDYERHLARDQPGLYESHYLKANSGDGGEAFWIKHNLLVPPGGGGIAEFWFIWFRRDESPRVWKREVPVGELTLGSTELALRGDRFQLDRSGCEGRIGDASWRLKFSGGLSPLFHFASPRMYRGSLPKKKLMTPAPNLRFDGELAIAGRTVAVAAWIGLRGHNWGSEHAYSYAYGSCNRWDDAATDRTVDGFTARIKLGRMLSPWLSSLIYWGEGARVERNGLRHWMNRSAVVEPLRWRLSYRGLELVMQGRRDQYAGLRYRHPGGQESYCYNTKFANVSVTTHTGKHTSDAGEHEVLFPEPLPDVPLHPAVGWQQADGDYQSSR
jgi:hypothetical protein